MTFIAQGLVYILCGLLAVTLFVGSLVLVGLAMYGTVQAAEKKTYWPIYLWLALVFYGIGYLVNH